MKLSDKAIKSLKPTQKPYKKADGGGLYLLVMPNGSKLWRLKYYIDKREKLLALGQYPDVPLSLARERRQNARALIAADTDPSEKKRADKASVNTTFEGVAEEWIAKQAHLTADTRERIRTRLKRWAYPAFGKKPISKVSVEDVLTALRSVEKRGTGDTAHRTRRDVVRILRYAVQTKRAVDNVADNLKGAIVPITGGHFAAITDPKQVGPLLRAIDEYRGQPSTEFALKIAPYVFLRPGELRGGLWTEIDLDAAEWRIPGERMKGRREHLVPLARQVVDLLRQLKAITGDQEYLFPALGYKGRPMSDNTLNVALRRMGYTNTQMTAHGFRSMASTLLNDLRQNRDVIELQLAHKEENKTRGAYNRSERIDDRRAMMQVWADYLDGLRTNIPT